MSAKNDKPAINICWLRRDLRLDDNAALYHALKAGNPVLLVFIFDQNILNKLGNKTDARVDFIHQQLSKINDQLMKMGSSLLVKHNTAEKAWEEIVADFDIRSVYANHDYEPYAKKRDEHISAFFRRKRNCISYF
jgi:deoxyribodipyrimidine photo-lyase